MYFLFTDVHIGSDTLLIHSTATSSDYESELFYLEVNV